MNENNEVHTQFFDSYTRALIDREAAAIAELYAMPALIEFPGQRILVTDAGQTHDFFAQAVGQYDGGYRCRGGCIDRTQHLGRRHLNLPWRSPRRAEYVPARADRRGLEDRRAHPAGARMNPARRERGTLHA